MSIGRRQSRVLSLCLLLAAAAPVWAQDPQPDPSSQASPQPAGPQAEVPADAYALVDGEPIGRDAVAALAKSMEVRPAYALDSLIGYAALEHRLRREGHDPDAVTPAQVAEQYGAQPSDDPLRARAQRINVAYLQYVESKVTADDLQTYYDEHKLELSGELRARQVQFPPSSQGLADAQAALAALGAAPTDEQVDQLARQRSIDPLGPVTGGDLDWFGPEGENALGLRVPPGISEACFKLGKPGLVPYPVATRGGYHLVFVIQVHQRADSSFEDLAPRLRRMLEERLFERTQRAWMQEAQVQYASDAPRQERRR